MKIISEIALEPDEKTSENKQGTNIDFYSCLLLIFFCKYLLKNRREFIKKLH